jgi:hypothetical protein
MEMSSPAPSTGVSFFYVFIVIVLLVLLRVVRRTYANYRGTRFSLARTIAFGCVYVGIGIFFSGLSFLDGVPPLLAIPEILLATSAAFWSYSYSDRRISFWKSSDGSLYFRGGILIYLIYTAGLITRLSIDILLIGPGMFTFASGIQPSGTALYGSMATDLVLIVGVGLLIGRSIRVARRYQRIKQGQESVLEASSTFRTRPRFV